MEPISTFLCLLLLLTVLHLFSRISLATATHYFPKGSLPTKSGYLPVNSTSCSAIFYTFYEAQKPISKLSQTPLLIWLQGGPGCSSMIGNFFEVGPWLLTSDENPVLKSNPYAWNRLFGLLFLDNPIGTGFSIVSMQQEIPKDHNEVAKHLLVAIQSYFALYPSFRSRPLYLTGESYAGKFIPATAYYILQQNSQMSRSHWVNLQGVAIGNGLTDPVAQVATHAETAYFSGLINEKQKTYVEGLQSEAVRLIQEGKWSEASDARKRVTNWLQSVTGYVTLFDVRKPRPTESDIINFRVFLQNEKVKEALGVDKLIAWEECSSVVGMALFEDVMKSVKFMVEELVKKSKVLLFQGQFDLIDGVVSTGAWVTEMEWEGLERFLKAERKVWKVNGELGGYVQKWGNLTNVIVAGAGHAVPADQGLSSQIMIEDWILGKGLFDQKGSVRFE
eukprot:TRINITY_DN1385_c0_g1_i6.p1 TRINITY_DN1385_c0_g1~~TRINITY_DN1385_c0_g1_i6.p1  ORF type:complete len:447 (-),score=58.56 TRINITY_DN1385_c0_g1_i6:68-1408(-)